MCGIIGYAGTRDVVPVLIGGIAIPYDSGQSGTARPEPVEVTIAPAKIRKSVEAATNFA